MTFLPQLEQELLRAYDRREGRRKRSRFAWAAVVSGRAGTGRRFTHPGTLVALAATVPTIAIALFALAAIHHGPSRPAVKTMPAAPGPAHIQSNGEESTAYRRIARLLAGIPQAGPRLGNAHAPVTIVLYGDLECPICRDLAQTSLQALVHDYVRTGAVKLIYRAHCTSTCNGPGMQVFTAQQAAAIAAGKQHRFWDYALLFLREQGREGTHYATAGYLEQLARQIPPLNLRAWQTDRVSAAVRAAVAADEAAATAQRVNATPTMVIEGPAGQRRQIVGLPTPGELADAIRQVQ